MRIAVDLDGTLAQTHEVFLEELERRDGISHELNDLESWEFENVNFSVERFNQIARENWRKREIPLTEPSIPEHLKAIQRAANKLDIVTARSDVSKNKLRNWLNRKNIPFNSLKVDKRKTDLGYDFLIDDSPVYLNSETSILLYHRPYNRNAQIGDLDKRVRSFKEIRHHIENKAQD